MTPGQQQFTELMEQSSKPGSINHHCNRRLVVLDRLFTPEECAEAIRTFAPFPREKGLVGSPVVEEDPTSEYVSEEIRTLRDCFVTYAPRTEDNSWVHDRLEKAMIEANDLYWRCVITDFSQPIRLMTYEEGHHFGSLHQDFGPGDSCYRKLTAVLQVSDPKDYEGGRFELCGEPMPPEAFNQGSVIIFPAYLVHRAGQVTSGLRQTIIHRAIGPWFR